MKNRFGVALLSTMLLANAVSAQVPVVPVAPVAPQQNLWSFLLPNAEQKAACKTCFCNSPIGQLLSSATGPMSMMSGGLIQNRCLENSIANDIAKKSPDSSEGAAARIKKDEEEAKARRMAVRYLGTVDCNRWPEAEKALLLSLRGDRNECVRFEAALSLRNGCCCTPAIIKALEHSVYGMKTDGFPEERSERVRAVASEALARCPRVIEEVERIDGPIKKASFQAPRPQGEYPSQTAMTQRYETAAPSNTRGLLINLQQSIQTQNGQTSVGSTVPAFYQPSSTLVGIFSHAYYGKPTIDASPRETTGTMQPDFAYSATPRQAIGWMTVDNVPFPAVGPLPAIGVPMPPR